MPQLLLPRLLPGANAFSTQQWWAQAVEAAGLAGVVSPTTEQYAAGQAADAVDLPDTATGLTGLIGALRRVGRLGDGPTVVVAVPTPLPRWLTGSSVDERLDALAGWEREVAAWTERGRLVIATTPAPVSLGDLLLLAAGLRAPLLDLTAEPAPPPRTPFATRLADAVGARLGTTFRAGWISRALGLADAIESAGLASAEVADVPPAEATRLRAATREMLGRLAASGISLVGPRDALLWPVPVADAVPLGLAAEVAAAVFDGVPERIDPVTLGLEGRLAEIDELDARLEQQRRQLAAVVDDPRNLRRLSGRKLLGLLATGGRRG